jgi:hypothetical protein
MRRGFPYGTSITCKKEGKIYVEGRILRSVTMSRDIHFQSDHLPSASLYNRDAITVTIVQQRAKYIDALE